MMIYQMTDEPNQEFTIEYNGVKIRIAMRYSPIDKNWYVGIIGIVHGVKLVYSIPLFAQYGFSRIFFYNIDIRFGLQSLNRTYLVVASDEDIEGIINPVIEADTMGIRVI